MIIFDILRYMFMDVFDFQTAVIKQFNRNFTMHSMYILVISVLIMHMYMYMAAMIKYMILYVTNATIK